MPTMRAKWANLGITKIGQTPRFASGQHGALERHFKKPHGRCHVGVRSESLY